jgi:hypothetical protein
VIANAQPCVSLIQVRSLISIAAGSEAGVEVDAPAVVMVDRDDVVGSCARGGALVEQATPASAIAHAAATIHTRERIGPARST